MYVYIYIHITYLGEVLAGTFRDFVVGTSLDGCRCSIVSFGSIDRGSHCIPAPFDPNIYVMSSPLFCLSKEV